jgi:hypothetical protein
MLFREIPAVLWEPYGTHKHTVWTESRAFKFKQVLRIAATVLQRLTIFRCQRRQGISLHIEVVNNAYTVLAVLIFRMKLLTALRVCQHANLATTSLLHAAACRLSHVTHVAITYLEGNTNVC